ncbi:MAG: TonB-dependent receptor [Candidimonas sp.]|nr:MAG: TonB-dependent receptor [Candidimonas sp.]
MSIDKHRYCRPARGPAHRALAHSTDLVRDVTVCRAGVAPHRLIARFFSRLAGLQIPLLAALQIPLLAAARTVPGPNTPPAAPAPANSASTPDDVARFTEITVKGKLPPESESDTPGDVSTVDARALRNAGNESLAQVLSGQHGIEFHNSGGPQTAAGISIRGANTDQTLVLVDGVPINGATSGLAALNALPVESVDHVEILRGAAASLTGASAIGGVIDIITREPRNQPFAGHASLGLGTYGTSRYAAGFDGGGHGWSYRFGASYGQSAGYNATNRANAYSYNPDRDGYYSHNVNGSVSYAWREGQKLTAQVYTTRINGGVDIDATRPFDERSIQTLRVTNLRSNNRITDFWHSALSVAVTLDKDLTRTAANDTTFATRQSLYAWRNDLTLAATQKLAIDFEYLTQNVSGDIPSFGPDGAPGPMLDFTRTRRNDKSATGTYSATVGANHFRASLHGDRDSQFGPATTWGLSYGRDLGRELYGYVAASTGYKAPTFNDLYYPGYANPRLRPERSRNLEAGLKFTADTYALDVVAYRNTIHDLITYDPNQMKPENLDQATLRGMTLTAEKNFHATTLHASIDLQDPRNDSSDKLLNRRARRIYRGSIEHHDGAWKFGGEYVFVGARYDDIANRVPLGGYGLLNLTAGYQIDRQLSVDVRWDNVLNRNYMTAYGYNTPGSNVFVTLRWRD